MTAEATALTMTSEDYHRMLNRRPVDALLLSRWVEDTTGLPWVDDSRSITAVTLREGRVTVTRAVVDEQGQPVVERQLGSEARFATFDTEYPSTVPPPAWKALR